MFLLCGAKMRSARRGACFDRLLPSGGSGRAREDAMPKVLLIEDHNETANQITTELVNRGFDVDWAATGIEGLDKARAAEADVMIVDRLLPGIDGLTIIEVARREHVRTPV